MITCQLLSRAMMLNGGLRYTFHVTLLLAFWRPENYIYHTLGSVAQLRNVSAPALADSLVTASDKAGCSGAPLTRPILPTIIGQIGLSARCVRHWAWANIETKTHLKMQGCSWTAKNQQTSKSELLFAQTIRIQQQLQSVGLKVKAQLEWQSADEHVTLTAIDYLSGEETGRAGLNHILWVRKCVNGFHIEKRVLNQMSQRRVHRRHLTHSRNCD